MGLYTFDPIKVELFISFLSLVQPQASIIVILAKKLVIKSGLISSEKSLLIIRRIHY